MCFSLVLQTLPSLASTNSLKKSLPGLGRSLLRVLTSWGIFWDGPGVGVAVRKTWLCFLSQSSTARTLYSTLRMRPGSSPPASPLLGAGLSTKEAFWKVLSNEYVR
jgi:hypothetical protein